MAATTLWTPDITLTELTKLASMRTLKISRHSGTQSRNTAALNLPPKYKFGVNAVRLVACSSQVR